MIFHTIADEGCRSYLIGCAETGACAVIDPALGQIDRTLGLIASEGLALRYVIETHTHADHFTAARGIRQRTGVPIVMHASGGAGDVDLRVEDGHQLVLGKVRLKVLRCGICGSDLHARHGADAWADMAAKAGYDRFGRLDEPIVSGSKIESESLRN